MKRKYLSGLIVLILIAFMLAACGSSGGDGDGNGGGNGNGGSTAMTTVSGTVLDINGDSIEGAEVTISSDPVTVTTDANGFFSATKQWDHKIKLNLF